MDKNRAIVEAGDGNNNNAIVANSMVRGEVRP